VELLHPEFREVEENQRPDRENTAEQEENTAESEENKMSRMQSVIVDTICSAYAKTIATILALISLKFVEASGRKNKGQGILKRNVVASPVPSPQPHQLP
jgi:hypothetical protein